MAARSFICKVFILIYLVNQNALAGSAQAVTMPFQSVSVSSKTNPSSAPCSANTFTFSSTSLPPVQTQTSQNPGRNYQALVQSSGPNCNNLGQSSVAQNLGQNVQQTLAQNVGQNLQQSLGQSCSQSVSPQNQYYQSLGQPVAQSSGVSQNVNPFISSQNIVFNQNQNQNSGLNNLVASPPVSSCSSPSQSNLNIVSGPSSTQGSPSLSVFSSGQPSINVASSGLNVVSSPSSGLNCGPLNLMTLNENYAPSQSSSNNLYPANIVSGNTGCSIGQNMETLSLNNVYNNNANLPPPQLSLNVQPCSQSCSSNNHPASNSGLSPQTYSSVQLSSQSPSQPKYTLTSLRPLNLNGGSGSNINWKSVSFQPNSNSPLQIPSTLPSANPCNSAPSNQYSLSLGVPPSLLQDLNNIPPPSYNTNAPHCVQNTPQVLVSPALSFPSLGGSCNQQLSLPSNAFGPTQNININPQQPTNSASSCNMPAVYPSPNFGQFTLQNPVNSGGSSSCSSLAGQTALQSQNSNSGVSCPQVLPTQNVQNSLSGLNLAIDQQMLNQLFSSFVSNTPSIQSSQNPVNSVVSSSCSSLAGQTALQSQNANPVVSCNSQVLPAQNIQNSLSGLNLALDQQMLNQLFSSIVSNSPSIQSSSCNSQVNAPQLNSYVQSSLANIPTTNNNNAYSNVGTSYVTNCGSSQNLGNVLQNPANNQVSNNIYNLYNQQSSNPYSSLGSQAPCSEYSNTLSSLPSVYTSNSNSYPTRLTPASILAAYNSNSAPSSINFESILSALSSPTITTEEIASLVSSLAESVLQQCNSLSSSSSAYPKSNLNALPISVSTTPVETSYTVPTYSSQYITQQPSVSYCNAPTLETVEAAPASPCSGSQAGIPIKVTISDAPFTSDSGSGSYSSGQSLYSSKVQPYYSVEPSVSVASTGGQTSSGNMGIKDFVKILVLSELFNGGGYGGGSGGFGGNGLDGGLLALLLATAT